MTGIIAERRASSSERLSQLSKRLTEATTICSHRACVFVTGSFGRGEGGPHSDLDVFIAGRSHRDREGNEVRELPRLDEICLKRELIVATRELKFPEFSGDGEYVKLYTIDELVRTTGRPEDDATNTFTARLLLLLESRPLIGDAVYQEAIDSAIEKYWRDFKGHEDGFVPAFLANDILRLWRTFCVNYEARTSDVPEDRKNKRRLKNYKLKYSRMLTCYSALIHLLAVHNAAGTVTPGDVRAMVAKGPTQRLEWLLTLENLSDAHGTIEKLLGQYSQFLRNTSVGEETMLERIADRATRIEYFREADSFGSTVFDLIERVGQRSPFHRMLVV